jgi:hypothetical protein
MERRVSMNYILIQVSNANEIWEADISASVDGFKPSTNFAHLFLSDYLPSDARQLTVGPILTAIGWAIQDEIDVAPSDSDDATDFVSYSHAVRARDLIRNAPENVEFIVKLDVGISKDDAVARLTDSRPASRRIA